MEHNDELDAKNQREHDADAGVGSSIDEAGTHDLDLDDFPHLDEDPTSDDSLKTDDEGELTTDEPKPVDEGDLPPFHEHPRWQQMLQERDQLQQQLEESNLTLEEQGRRLDEYDRHLRMMDTLQRMQPQVAAQPEPELQPDPFDEILAMPEEDIIEEFQKSPRQFLQQFGESIEHKAMRQAESVAFSRAQEDAVNRGIDQFAEDNPDFMDMVMSGDIARFIERNPIHNAISAYHTLKLQGEPEVTDAEIEAYENQIREDERQRTLESVRAKQGATVLDGGTDAGPDARTQTHMAPDLQDTEKHGGKVSVIAQRLKALRERF